MPHTVQLDNKGRPWFSGNKNGTVGWIDPATGKATVYKMPDPKSDPHTLAFDKNGMLFFSFQASNMIGRLNPETGDIKVVEAPNPKSQPYDVKFDADGTVVGLVQCARLPAQGQPGDDGSHRNPVPAGRLDAALRHRARRHDLVRNSNRGGIGRYNPKTGEFKEWQSPSGARSHPYGVGVAGRRLLVQRVRHAARHRWSASTPRPRRSRAGRSRPATSTPASCAMRARRGRAIS